MTAQAQDGTQDKAWQQAFQSWLDGQPSPARQRDYQRIWAQFQAACGKSPSQVTAADVQAWAAQLEQDGYAPSTIRTYLASLSSFYQFVMGESRRVAGAGPWPGLVPRNPVSQGARPQARPYSGARVLSPAEQAALLGAIDVETAWGKRDYALLLFLLRSGRRTKDILALRWADFEVGREGAFCRWEDGLRRLDWDVWLAVYRYLQGCGRLAKMGEQEAIFTPLTDLAGRVEAFYGPGWQEHSLAEVSVGRLIQMYAGWAGLPAEEITPKTLRYTAAANLLEAGCSLEELKEFMGHTDIDVTRAFVNGIEKGKQQGSRPRSYLSKRRSVGAPPGNRNAGGLQQYLAAAKADGVFEELVDVLKAEPGFDGEILLLRLALRAVLDDMLECDDLHEAIKRLKVVGSAAERIGGLVYKRWKMKQVTQADEMQAALRQAIDELMQERRQTGTAAARE